MKIRNRHAGGGSIVKRKQHNDENNEEINKQTRQNKKYINIRWKQQEDVTTRGPDP